jgi:hypothetical protein
MGSIRKEHRKLRELPSEVRATRSGARSQYHQRRHSPRTISHSLATASSGVGKSSVVEGSRSQCL